MNVKDIDLNIGEHVYDAYAHKESKPSRYYKLGEIGGLNG